MANQSRIARRAMRQGLGDCRSRSSAHQTDEFHRAFYESAPACSRIGQSAADLGKTP